MIPDVLLIWVADKNLTELYTLDNMSELPGSDIAMLRSIHGKRLARFCPEEDYAHERSVRLCLGLIACRVANKDSLRAAEPEFAVERDEERAWQNLFPLVPNASKEVGTYRKYLRGVFPDNALESLTVGPSFVVISGLRT